MRGNKIQIKMYCRRVKLDDLSFHKYLCRIDEFDFNLLKDYVKIGNIIESITVGPVANRDKQDGIQRSQYALCDRRTWRKLDKESFTDNPIMKVYHMEPKSFVTYYDTEWIIVRQSNWYIAYRHVHDQNILGWDMCRIKEMSDRELRKIARNETARKREREDQEEQN